MKIADLSEMPPLESDEVQILDLSELPPLESDEEVRSEPKGAVSERVKLSSRKRKQ